jgi:hypothetical protein
MCRVSVDFFRPRPDTATVTRPPSQASLLRVKQVTLLTGCLALSVCDVSCRACCKFCSEIKENTWKIMHTDCYENNLNVVLYENEELKHQGVWRCKVSSLLCNLARLCWNMHTKCEGLQDCSLLVLILFLDLDAFASISQEHAVSIFIFEVSTVSYVCKWTLRPTYHTHFDLEDGGSVFLWNVGSTAAPKRW